MNHSIRARGAIAILFLAGALAGCSDEIRQRFMGRWGPDPSMPSSSVAATMQNQTQVLYYLLCDSSLAACQNAIPASIPGPGSPVWFEVAQWGFNVGRQDCEIYLDNLFRLAREKSRNDNILAGIGTYAAAIVAATTPAQKPLSIIAAALGFSVALNNAVFDSYLFTQAPGLIANKVKEMQDTYRDKIAQNRSLIQTPADAYNAIQNYYRICLPHAIEGALIQNVANGNAVDPKGGSPAPAGLKRNLRSTNNGQPSLNSTPALQ